MEWQAQEVFTNPPFGLVRRLDLLARVEELTRDEKYEERLIDVEVESAESLGEARKKIAYYYPALRTQRNRPVTMLALYLRVGLKGVGEDEYVETEAAEDAEGRACEQVRFRVGWRYVGLPALPAEEYLRGDDWLGVALSALMKIEPERKPWLRAEILTRLATECEVDDYRKLLLINLVDTYLPMRGDQQTAYDKLIAQDSRYREAQSVIKTTYDKGYDQGYDKGVQDSQAAIQTTFDKGKCEALRAMIVRLAGKRCGAPDEAVRGKLGEVADVARLEALAEAAASAVSWDELLGS